MAKKREPLLFLGDISKAIQKTKVKCLLEAKEKQPFQIGAAIIEMRDVMYPSILL